MTADYQGLSRKAAEAIAEQLRVKPDSCLGLPTGRSPIGCYEYLRQWTAAGQLDWSRARIFALDDYLDADESKSFQQFLQDNLVQHINLPADSLLNPRFCDDYDSVIDRCGGLDLTMVGIGTNGHIAFNEPGTARLSWTHCVWLTDSTRQANANYFNGAEKVPHRAVTIGLETILRSRKLVLLVSGKHKEAILSRALNEPPTTAIPASFLHEHRHLKVFADFELSH